MDVKTTVLLRLTGSRKKSCSWLVAQYYSDLIVLQCWQIAFDDLRCCSEICTKLLHLQLACTTRNGGRGHEQRSEEKISVSVWTAWIL
jgi:hypothetical protein